MESVIIAISFLVPLLMIVFGTIFLKKVPKSVNSFLGYRTSMSMLNKDTWEFAHVYCGKIWILFGSVGLILNLIAVLCGLVFDRNMIELVCVISIAIQCVMILVTIFLVEKKLEKNFDREGNRKVVI